MGEWMLPEADLVHELAAYPGLARCPPSHVSTLMVGWVAGHHWPGCPGAQQCWCGRTWNDKKQLGRVALVATGMDPDGPMGVRRRRWPKTT